MQEKKGWARFIDWFEGCLKAHTMLMYVLIYCFYLSVKSNNAACITATGVVLCGAFGIRTSHAVMTYKIDAENEASDQPTEPKVVTEKEPTTGELQ